MPHFVVDCSESILSTQNEQVINEQVHLAANSTMLFEESDIKVRINPFKTYIVGNKKKDFIHVFASIMSGRTTQQKADLSKVVVAKLCEMFPDVESIAMNISEFDKATYYNRAML